MSERHGSTELGPLDRVRDILRRPLVRWLTFGLGILLLILAIGFVMRQRGAVEDALAAIREPNPVDVVLLLGASIVNVALTSIVFQLLLSRYGRVGFIEMQAVVATASLMNLLPMRAGLFGRLAYHKKVNGIALTDSAKTVVQSLSLTLVMGVLLAGLVAAATAAGIAWWWGAVIPLGALAVAGLARTTRVWCWAAAVRELEMLLFAARYVLAFRLMGLSIEPPAATAMAVSGALASVVPVTSNGLGVREWVIGAIAPLTSRHALEIGLTADLVNRAAEVIMALVLGAIGVAILSRIRNARVTPQP